MGEGELALIVADGGHGDLDATHTDPHQRCALEQLETDGAAFEPVERRFAGHRRAVLARCHQLVGQHSHDRVVAQLVMINRVLVAPARSRKTRWPDCRPEL